MLGILQRRHGRRRQIDGAARTSMLVVGVNGTGKTTTVGKLANLLSDSGAHR